MHNLYSVNGRFNHNPKEGNAQPWISSKRLRLLSRSSEEWHGLDGTTLGQGIILERDLAASCGLEVIVRTRLKALAETFLPHAVVVRKYRRDLGGEHVWPAETACAEDDIAEIVPVPSELWGVA